MKLFADKDRLWRHSGLMLAASVFANGGNFVFHMIMGRLLTEAEMGVLWAMLGSLMILGAPAEAIRMTVARYAAEFKTKDNPHLVRQLFRKSAYRLTFVAVPLLAAGLVLANPLARFFRIDSCWPVMITTLIAALNLVSPIAGGAQLGLQRFGQIAWVSVAGVFVRIACGGLFAWLTFKAAGGLLGSLGYTLIALFGPIWMLRAVLLRGGPRTDDGQRLETGDVYRYFWPALAAYFLGEIISNADLIAVKHFFTPEAAGGYSQAAAIARLVIYAAAPISLAMFPKIVEQSVRQDDPKRTLLRAVGLCTLITVCAAAFCSLFPKVPLLLIFGGAHLELHGLVRAVSWGFAPVGIFKMLLLFLMARSDFRAVPWLAALAAGYAGALACWHPGPHAVVALVFAFASAAMLLAAAFAWRRGRGNG
ncbi:MAG: oligosaccharide flippase family protein [Kiritimatiellae bacterium]|nr:oligosaccharide flippase family protein [Kiritimatiellia bacterium]